MCSSVAYYYYTMFRLLMKTGKKYGKFALDVDDVDDVDRFLVNQHVNMAFPWFSIYFSRPVTSYQLRTPSFTNTMSSRQELINLHR